MCTQQLLIPGGNITADDRNEQRKKYCVFCSLQRSCILMALCEIAVNPLVTSWSYLCITWCNRAPSHYLLWCRSGFHIKSLGHSELMHSEGIQGIQNMWYDMGDIKWNATHDYTVVLKMRTMCHAWDLWKLARSHKQLCLLCRPDPRNLSGTALLRGFQLSWRASV